MPESVGLAFKAYKIEELADVYFFRPLGMVVARAARALRLTPTAVTLVGALVGVAGGLLLYDPRLGVLAFGLIVLHGILDSSDGQLARMTGQVTEFGRVLDGVGGYVTHFAIYFAIAAGLLSGGGSAFPWSAGATPPLAVVIVTLVAGLSSAVHAQLYDYHRSAYTRTVVRGVATPPAKWHGRGILRFYEAMQRKLSASHDGVEERIASRSTIGVVREDDRERYRECFYRPVRGWNLLGDNTRFYAIGLLVWGHRLNWYFAFVLLPMNAAFAALWWWQERADRRFLAGL